jgi:hypothetical protein
MPLRPVHLKPCVFLACSGTPKNRVSNTPLE